MNSSHTVRPPLQNADHQGRIHSKPQPLLGFFFQFARFFLKIIMNLKNSFNGTI